MGAPGAPATEGAASVNTNRKRKDRKDLSFFFLLFFRCFFDKKDIIKYIKYK